MPADSIVICTPPTLSFDARRLHISPKRRARSNESRFRKLSRILRPKQHQFSRLCFSTLVDTELTETPRPVQLTAVTPEMTNGSNVVKEELPHDDGRPETHLMLFINGLNGNAGNWDVLIDKLTHYASANEIAILVSTANMSLKVPSSAMHAWPSTDFLRHIECKAHAGHLPQQQARVSVGGATLNTSRTQIRIR